MNTQGLRGKSSEEGRVQGHELVAGPSAEPLGAAEAHRRDRSAHKIKS